MLSTKQKKNIPTILASAEKFGITNKFAQAAFLAVLYKESGFEPKRENMNYSAKRIREVFPSIASRANALAYKPEALANATYGGRYGNGPLEGFKFRGGGLNQITFKANYEKYGKLIGVDLVASPEKITNLSVASDVAAVFAIEGMKALQKSGKLAVYNAKDINDFKNAQDALHAFYHVNAGTGKKTSAILSLDKTDTLKGYTTAKKALPELLTIVNNQVEKKK